MVESLFSAKRQQGLVGWDFLDACAPVTAETAAQVPKGCKYSRLASDRELLEDRILAFYSEAQQRLRAMRSKTPGSWD
jgi:hypothetical protein